MAKFKGLKLTNEVVSPSKEALANATDELNAKLAAKFPMVLTSGKGKEKVSLTISIVE